MTLQRNMLIGLATVLVGAAATAPRSVSQQGRVFRSGVDLVRVDAMVADNGRPVSGLTASDFEVTDNGVRQEIELVTTATTVKVVLVLDASGSVAGEKLEHLKAACRSLFGGLRGADSAALLTFSERLTLHLREERDAGRLVASLDDVQAFGRTAMRDAIYAGLSFAAPDTSRTLLILFSDGVDNASWISAAALLEALRHSSVIVYPVGSGSSVEGVKYLDQIAEAGGGEHVAAAANDRLAARFVEILDRFRSRYLLSYTPTGVRRNDGWHELKVRLKSRKGSVKARPGYFSG